MPSPRRHSCATTRAQRRVNLPTTHPITPAAGKVTHSVVYNNMTLATVTENTMKDVQTPGFAVFPTGEGPSCWAATV